MKKLTIPILLLLTFLILLACQTITTPPEQTPEPDIPIPGTPALLTPTPFLTLQPISTPEVITATPLPTVSATAVQDQVEEQEEFIMILQPGPGSRVTSPVTISGYAGPIPGQHLMIRILDEDGLEIGSSFTTVMAEAGMRGPFSEEVAFSVMGERQGFIQVFTESPRDGGRTHLSSVGLRLSSTGPEEVRIVTPYPERIEIFKPRTGDTLSGGAVLVEGFALASFEQTLIVAVLDEDGKVLNMEPVTVRAPDLGYHGPFGIIMYYSISESQPGRIVVIDPSPAHGDDTHLSSVEVFLEP
jgi:hypothetical protein